MPKRNHRPKRDVPIKARYNFCMHCLRHVNNTFDFNEGAVYDISCLLNIQASILYQFCAERNKTYDLVGFIYRMIYMYDLLISVKPVTGLLRNTHSLIEIIK